MMFDNPHQYSSVTAIVPAATVNRVVDTMLNDAGTSALAWNSRGTLLTDHWYRRLLPPISPAKTMLQLLVAEPEVDDVVSQLINLSKIDKQATGAVYTTPCQHAYVGPDYHVWPSSASNKNKHTVPGLDEHLSMINCIVDHRDGDKVSLAAINAGAHGPIVHYTEGLGLRDRLGWLRITKEHEKELLMVIVDRDDANDVFDAMADVGQLHLPGRGFMYQTEIARGIYNLPSRISHHHYAANMHQIINAIDHLSGHTHWRDHSTGDAGLGKRVIAAAQAGSESSLTHRICLSGVVNRDHLQPLMDLMLDAGAPGLNIHHTRYFARDEECQMVGARINQEYSMVRCIVDQNTANSVSQAIEEKADAQGITDMCMLAQPVTQLATYVPSHREFRSAA